MKITKASAQLSCLLLSGCFMANSVIFPEYGDEIPLKPGKLLCSSVLQSTMIARWQMVVHEKDGSKYTFTRDNDSRTLSFTKVPDTDGLFISVETLAPNDVHTGAQSMTVAHITSSALVMFAFTSTVTAPIAKQKSIGTKPTEQLEFQLIDGKPEDMKAFLFEVAKHIDKGAPVATCMPDPRT